MTSFDTYWNGKKTVSAFRQKPPSQDLAGVVAHHIPQPESQTALDLGCGGGRHTVWLATQGFSTSACDLHTEMVSATKAALADNKLQATVVQASALSLPYADGSFDFIVSTGVLHNFTMINELATALQEAARVCRKDGLFYLTIFTDGIISPELKKTGDHLYTTADDIPMLLVASPDVDRLCHTAGFVKKEVIREYVTEVETGKRAVYTCLYTKT